MKAHGGGDPLRIAKWLTVGMFATAFGCNVYDEGLAPRRDPVGAGGSQAGAGGVAADASFDRGASGGASAGNGGASGAAGSGAAGSGGSSGGGAGGSGAGAAGSNPDASDAPRDQGSDPTIDIAVDVSGRDGTSVDAQLDSMLDTTGPAVDAPSPDSNIVDAGVVDVASDGGPVVGLPYNIIAKHSGKCMTVLANLPLDGNEIIQVACSNADSQRYRLEAAANGTFIIVNDSWNKCARVDISDSATVNHLQIGTCDGSAAQSYTVIPVNVAGGYTIKNGAQCMEVDGASTADLPNILAANCDGAANQIWEFVPAPKD